MHNAQQPVYVSKQVEIQIPPSPWVAFLWKRPTSAPGPCPGQASDPDQLQHARSQPTPGISTRQVNHACLKFTYTQTPPVGKGIDPLRAA